MLVMNWGQVDGPQTDQISGSYEHNWQLGPMVPTSWLRLTEKLEERVELSLKLGLGLELREREVRVVPELG